MDVKCPACEKHHGELAPGDYRCICTAEFRVESQANPVDWEGYSRRQREAEERRKSSLGRSTSGPFDYFRHWDAFKTKKGTVVSASAHTTSQDVWVVVSDKPFTKFIQREDPYGHLHIRIWTTEKGAQEFIRLNLNKSSDEATSSFLNPSTNLSWAARLRSAESKTSPATSKASTSSFMHRSIIVSNASKVDFRKTSPISGATRFSPLNGLSKCRSAACTKR